MEKLSREFLIRLKLNPEPAYRIAQRAGINPTTLSRLINRIEPVRPSDQRILRVAKVLGLAPEDAFDDPSGCERGSNCVS